MAKKHLGQNFLKSKKAIYAMIDAASVSLKDLVVEIGPGKGAITGPLLERASKVVAFEKDKDLIPLLENMYAQTGKLNLYEQDVLEFDPGLLRIHAKSYKVVANIPYYITGAIFRHFLESSFQPTSMTLLVQKEVAERIVCRDGKESILSLSIKAYGNPRYILKVGREYFTPKPEVDSAIIHIADISQDFFKDFSQQDFFRVVKLAFQFKRKNIVNNLKQEFPHIESVLGYVGVDPKTRAEDLSLDDFAQLTKQLIQK